MTLSGLGDILSVLRGNRTGAFLWADLAVVVLGLVCLGRLEYLSLRRARARALLSRLRMLSPGLVMLVIVIIVRRAVDY